MTDLNTINGLQMDLGTMRGVMKESRSQKTSAIRELSANIDSIWGGGHLRHVRVVPVVEWNDELDAMANKEPELALHLRRFLTAEYPGDRLEELESLISGQTATYNAPALVIRPVSSMIVSSYGKSNTVSQSLLGAFQGPEYESKYVLKTLELGRATRYIDSDLVDAWSLRGDIPKEERTWKLSECTLVHGSFMAKDGYEVVLVPVSTGGAAPFVAQVSQPPYSDETTVRLKYPVKWAVAYMENSVDFQSPVTAIYQLRALVHLVRYLNGEQMNPGNRNFGNRTKPIELLASIMAFMLQKAADSYVFTPTEQFMTSENAKLIKAIANFVMAWRNVDVMLNAMLSRTEVMMFFNTFLLGNVYKGVKRGRYNVPVMDDRFSEWFYNEVLSPILPKKGQTPDWMKRILTGALGPFVNQDDIKRRGFDSSFKATTMPEGLSPAEQDAWIAANAQPEDAASFLSEASFDLAGREYVAAYLQSQFKESIPVLLSAIRGEIPGMEVLQYAGDPVDLDVSVSILEALDYTLNISTQTVASSLQFATPYRQFSWGTQFANMICRVEREPIDYAVYNLAEHYSTAVPRELRSVIPGIESATIPDLEKIFQGCGFSYVMYGPDFLKLYSSDMSDYRRVHLTNAGKPVRWYSNAPLAHMDVEMQVVMPMWSTDAWTLIRNTFESNTPRTYFPFPVSKVVNKTNILVVDLERLPKWVRKYMETLGYVFTAKQAEARLKYLDVPALFDIAMIIPYIREYENKALQADDLDHSNRIDVDAEHSMYNIAGTLVLPETVTPSDAQTVLKAANQEWRLPSLKFGFSYTHITSGIYSEPLLFQSSR